MQTIGLLNYRFRNARLAVYLISAECPCDLTLSEENRCDYDLRFRCVQPRALLERFGELS